MRRPDNIAFGVNDPLPTKLALGLALQQLAFLGALMIIPDIYARAAGWRSAAAFWTSPRSRCWCRRWLSCCRCARCATWALATTTLQATGAVLPGMYLVASLPGTGLQAVFGMIWVVGLTQIAFSFLIMRMRNIFTTEVSGVAVMLIGLGLGALGLQQITGTRLSHGQPLTGASLLTGALALGTMIGCNVWAKGLLKLMAPLAGLLVGMALSLLLDLMPEQLHAWQQLAWVRLPQLPVFGWSFEPMAIAPYIVTGFVLSLTSMGTQTIVQRSADADWVRPHLRPLARGVRAEGVAHLFAALVNGLPLAASGGAVSLAAASAAPAAISATGRRACCCWPRWCPS